MSFPQLPHLVIMAIRSKLAVHVTWIKMILLKTRWEQSRRRPSAQEVLIPIYLESTLFTPLRLRSMITVNQRNTGSVAGVCGPTLVNGLSMHNGMHHFRDFCLIASQGRHFLKYFCCCHDESQCPFIFFGWRIVMVYWDLITCICIYWACTGVLVVVQNEADYFLLIASMFWMQTTIFFFFFCPLSFFRPLKSKVCNLKNYGFLICCFATLTLCMHDSLPLLFRRKKIPFES